MSRRAVTAAGTVAAVGFTSYWAMMSSQSQLLGHFPSRGPIDATQRPTLALTFDDGPNEPFTSRLTRILGARGVLATFFQVGQAVARFPDTSRELRDAGHVLGNHSYSHQLHRCLTAGAIDEEIRRAQDVFGETLHLRPHLFRPPWLTRTPATFRVLRRHQLLPVSGTFCHPLEVAQIGARRISARALSRSSSGGMIIFHDGHNGRGADRSQTLDAVARLIDRLGERGWSFTTVDRLLGVEPYSRTPA